MNAGQITFRLKLLTRWILTRRPVNIVLTRVMRPLFSLLPARIHTRIPVSGTIRIRLNDGDEVLMTSDGVDSIATRIHWGGVGSFEKSTIDLFSRLLPCSRTVIDVGANTGIYTLIAGNQDRDRTVWAFEALPRVYSCLEANVRLNKFTNVNTMSCAVTNFDGEATLHVPATVMLPTSSSTLEGFRQAVESLTVPARTLDSIVREHSIEQIDLMKIDTEATEPQVIEGAREMLQRDEPIIICEVLKGRTEKALEELLVGSGYKAFWITDNQVVPMNRIEGDSSYKNRDFVFVTDKRLADLKTVENITSE